MVQLKETTLIKNVQYNLKMVRRKTKIYKNTISARQMLIEV